MLISKKPEGGDSRDDCLELLGPIIIIIIITFIIIATLTMAPVGCKSEVITCSTHVTCLTSRNNSIEVIRRCVNKGSNRCRSGNRSVWMLAELRRRDEMSRCDGRRD